MSDHTLIVVGSLVRLRYFEKHRMGIVLAVMAPPDPGSGIYLVYEATVGSSQAFFGVEVIEVLAR